MEVSIFLAKLIGLYLLISALLCVFRGRQMKSMAKELVASKSILAVSGEISLIFGLVIVIDHSVWEYSWRGLITALGYLMILRGIMRFAFPSKVRAFVASMTRSNYWIVLIVMVVLGGYLTYCGFTYSHTEFSSESPNW